MAKWTSFNIAFIGAGNVAWHLAPALENAGHVVKEVYSRNTGNAKSLIKKLYDAEVSEDLDFSQSEANIFIISVSDDAIEDIAQEIVLPEGSLLVHTSGAKPLSVLEFAAADYTGVFYPLQTFTKERKVNFEHIPFCLESEAKEAEKIMHQLAGSISKNVQLIDSKKRAALHVAAVFASNFTNHMLSISEEILSQTKLNQDLLKPLVAETIEKSLMVGPKKAQTGPAKRGDLETLDKHLEILQDNEGFSEIYRIVSQHILDSYQ